MIDNKRKNNVFSFFFWFGKHDFIISFHMYCKKTLSHIFHVFFKSMFFIQINKFIKIK